MKLSDTVLVALIAATPPTILSAGSLITSLKTQDKVEVIHKATNSLTDRLVAVTRSDALQEGHADGVKDQKAEAKKGAK